MAFSAPKGVFQKNPGVFGEKSPFLGGFLYGYYDSNRTYDEL